MTHRSWALRTALAASASLALAPAAAFAAPAVSGPVTVDLRIEGPSTTFFDGEVTTAVRTFDFTGGSAAQACDGTAAAGGSSPTPFVSSGAAVAKVIADGAITATGTLYSFGPSFSVINGTSVAYDGTTGSYLYETLNGEGTSAGMCATPIADGDEIVLGYAGFGSRVLALDGPATAAPGTTPEVTVTDLGTGAPVQGASVGGATTDAAGKATLSAIAPGDPLTLKATKAGAIRSGALEVCITNGSDGKCGSPAAPAPVTVDLRIEGPTETFFDGEVTTSTRTFDFTGGAAYKRCDATSGAGGSSPDPKVTSGAAVAKVIADGAITATGSLFSFGPSFSAINGTSVAYDGATGHYLFETLNGEGTGAGMCGTAVTDGDEIVLGYAGFGSRVLELSGPATVDAGQPLTVAVTDLGTGDPVAGASVGGATTGADGKATITGLAAGNHTLKASKDGAIRSGELKLTVHQPAAVPNDQPAPPAPPVGPAPPKAPTGVPTIVPPAGPLSVSKAGAFTLPLACAAQRCAGKLTVTYQPPKSKGKRRKPVPIATSTVNSGASTVKVGLSRRGKRALARRSKANATVTVTPADGGAPVTRTITLTLPKAS